nr:ribonuclease H-like domain-containing protein [Tanacetum cinerariifolium]
EDANMKLSRSLPPAFVLIMRNKPDIKTLSMDDLYNNLKTVNAAHDIHAAGSKEQPSASSYADDVMFSFFASQSNTSQLDNEDLEQFDTVDLEEMDLKWQVALITMRVKKFMKRTGRNLNFNGKEPVGFDKTRVK